MDAQSYRPISNLTVVSKLLERIVARQLQSYTCSHLISYRLFSPVFDQATQQKLPSLRVMSDLLEAVDSGDVAALVFLDLSAVCCLCDTEPWYLVSAVAGHLWIGWPGSSGLVPFLSSRPVTVRPTWHV